MTDFFNAGQVGKSISSILKETLDMKEGVFLATLGTVMKVYSIKNNIPMKDMVLKFCACILEAEGCFDSLD